jgi:hypothetical protein
MEAHFSSPTQRNGEVYKVKKINWILRRKDHQSENRAKDSVIRNCRFTLIHQWNRFYSSTAEEHYPRYHHQHARFRTSRCPAPDL